MLDRRSKENNRDMARGSNILRHGVKSITFRLARNFCLSASKWPRRATMYPGKLTQTTSRTASKTSKQRCDKEGCDGAGAADSKTLSGIS